MSRAAINQVADAINPCPPTRGREKEGKGRETYKLNIKTSFTNNINNKRNKTKYTKLILSFPALGAGMLVSHQQLPGSTRKSRTGLFSKQEPDSGMHGSESGSELQTGQGAGSSSEGDHGRRQRDLRDPPALN